MVFTWKEIDNLYKSGYLKKYITDANKKVVLIWTSENGHLDIVKYLVEKCGAVLLIPNPKDERYLIICERGEEKRRERAIKKIYFWWVQVCYDVKRPCGNRMMKRNYEEYCKIVF